jgi:hypothetical protein
MAMMGHCFRRMCMRCQRRIAISLFLAFLVIGHAAAAPPIGSAVQTSTTVSASGRILQKSSPVFLNDVLRSSATGLGQFVFDDGTKLAMGPSASVTIDKSIYKGKSVQRASIQASKGAFRFISGKLSGRKIATPYGTIGIRGTAFDFTIRNGRVYVLLFRGAVSFCGGGGCKTITRTCDYIVAGGGKVSNPQPLSTGVRSGLNVGQIFPLVANQSRLTSQFRQGGKACLTQVAKRQQPAPVQAAISEPPAPGTPNPPGTPEPPGSPAPSGKGNKGLGNGGEADDNGNSSESNNPGNGGGNN